MIQYWPNKQSTKLNNAIVEMFLVAEKKIEHNLSNQTKYYLYTDILSSNKKYILFKTIINEFKNLVLDII